MPINFIVALMPLITKLLTKYIESSSSKKDDEILDIVKIGATYLANKDNNNVSKNDVDSLNCKGMTNG